ncbi:MAG: DUF1631 domain-containing protein [Cellvibrionaceae bacterium]
MSDFSGNSNHPNASVGRYPNATIVAHLKACQKIAVDHARELFDSFEAALEGKLSDFVAKAKSNEEARQLQDTVRGVRNTSSELSRRFVGYLGEGFVKFKSKQLNTRTGDEKYRRDMLSLVDDEDLEETIALSSVAHRADETFGEPLWFLNQRLAVLNDGQKVDEANNPVSPLQFCEALRKAMSILPLSTKAKVIAYKVFDRALSDKLGGVLDDINHYLRKQDILPNLRYVGVGEPGALPQFAKFDEAIENLTENTQQRSVAESRVVTMPDRNLPPEQYQGRLVEAIRTLQNHITGAPATTSQSVSPPPAANGGGGPVYSNHQLVSALQGLQIQALSATGGLANASAAEYSAAIPQTISIVGQQLAAQLKEEAEDGQLDPVDMHTIDLVGMLFEYMLSDDQLPDSIKAILSYLHTPFLKVAFVDSSFFEKTEHPARLLLNSLAEAGTRWVSNDGTSQYEIYSKIKETVSRVLEDFDNDVRLFAELLLDFSSYVKKIARRQDLMEKRAMEKVQGEEKLREVKVQVNKEIRSRTDGKELPSAVLLLLLQPWSDYMAFLLLRYGDESESWKKALTAVDDILWSIEAKDDSGDKARQMELSDDLLEVIEGGFETIGYDQSKGKKLIEALVSLQKMAMQSKKVQPAPAPMRDKLETEAAAKAGHQEEPTQKATPDEEKMVENLKMIEFGTWFEFEGGKRLKVAWYNSKTMHYMLVDQMGKKVAMKSGLELARGMLAGTARVIAGSTKPFFERALENIFQNLNARAEAIKSEASDG